MNAGMRSKNCTLDHVAAASDFCVVKIAGPESAPEWARWLEEVGFVPGESVQVVTRAPLGGDPMVVRVGQSTFALRKAEAACIEVTPSPASATSLSAVQEVQTEKL